MSGEITMLDEDHELALGMHENVLIAYWNGPHDTRNGRRLEAAMRQAAKTHPELGFVAIVEPSAPPPDRIERRRIVGVMEELDIQAISTVIRGKEMRRAFVTMVLTAMLLMVRTDLARRTSFCTSETDAAEWQARHLRRAPARDALRATLEALQPKRA